MVVGPVGGSVGGSVGCGVVGGGLPSTSKESNHVSINLFVCCCFAKAYKVPSRMNRNFHNSF